MLQQGVCSGLGPVPWRQSALGGTDCVRLLPRFAADARGVRSEESSCNKQQVSGRRLSPGVSLMCCCGCRFCVLFSLMDDAESPRTPFDLLYTRMLAAATQFQLDNGCNLHSFIKARAPAHFADMRMLIDEPHYRGHTNCTQNYNTGVAHASPSLHAGLANLRTTTFTGSTACIRHQQPLSSDGARDYNCNSHVLRVACDDGEFCSAAHYRNVLNSPLAEQKNAVLRRLERSIASMSQPVAMLYLRTVLYGLNQEQLARNTGVSWQMRSSGPFV